MKKEIEKIYDAIDDIMLLVDRDNNIESINSQGLSYLNKTNEQVVGQKCHQIIWQKTVPCSFCPFLQSQKTGQAESIEKPVPTLGNRWFSIKSSPITDNSGKIQGFVDVLRDITQQKDTEEKLKESNEKYLAINEKLSQINYELNAAKERAEENELEFRELFEHMSQGFALHEIILDKQNKPVDYKFIHINKAYETINKIDASNFIGRRVKEVLPNIEEHWIENFGEVALTGKPLHFENFSREFDKFYDVFTYSPRKGYFAVIYTDVTLSKKYEKELHLAKEKAQKSDRLKSAFLANMSHEIRSPMNAIIGFSEMINNQRITEEKRLRFTKIINRTSYQLLNIVNDILDISKIESGNIDIISKPLNINQVFTEATHLFTPEAQKKGIHLSCDLPCEDHQVMLMGDKLRIRQILDNIIKNAIKFTRQGYINTGYKLYTDKIEFYVNDTGSGINQENLSRIFDRFWQENTDLKNNRGGTGLGLSICKSLVEKMNGKIWAESEIGKGTRFTFTLPFVPIEVDAKEKSSNYSSIPQNNQLTKPMNLLIAEDDEVNFFFLKELFLDHNINIHHAPNGMKAVEMCKLKQMPDLVLMDIKMPELDGVQAMQKIKMLNPHIPVVALTAYAMKEDKEKFEKNGFDGYLSKPVDVEKLFHLIELYQ